MELTNEQITQLKAKGLDDAKISALAQQNGYKLPAPKTLSQYQVEQLKSKGLDDSKIQALAQQNGYELPKIGGFQSFVQSLASPVLKGVSSIASIGVDTANYLKGGDFSKKENKVDKVGVDYGYFGVQKPIGAGFDINKPIAENVKPIVNAIGTGAELASYLPVGSGVNVLRAGLKGKLISGAVEGALAGGLSGGAMGFGQAAQEAELKPSDVAYKTLFGTLAGVGLGGALGAITPIAVKTAGEAGKVIRRYKNVGEINKELNKLNTVVFKPTPRQLEKWSVQGKDPINTFTEIFGKEVPAVGSDNRFTKESIGDFVQRVNDVYKPAAEGFNTILRNSPEVNSITKARDMAIKNLDAYNLTPESYNKAVQKIDNEFNAIANEAKRKGVLLGDDSIPVAYSDNLKDRFWGATKNFGTEDATIANAVNSSIGHGFKDSIEEVITDLNVKNYNKRLGDLIVLRDFLESKSGALSGTGGKMTRLMSRLAGSVVGAQGGPLGSIIGTITGDKLAQILIDPAYQPYRWLINKKLQQLPQAEVLKLEREANNVIQKMYQRRMETFALPAGSPLGSANNPIKLPAYVGESSVKSVPAIKTLPTVDPKTGRMKTTYSSSVEGNQPLSKSDSIPPTTSPTMITPNNANIDKSIPPKTSKVNALINEARKYKTAEEFVKAQPTLYHGSETPLQTIDISKAKTANYGKGIYLTDNSKLAKYYSTIKTRTSDLKSAKIEDLAKINTRVGSVNDIRLDTNAKIKVLDNPTQKLIDQAKKDGYDGVQFKDTIAKEDWDNKVLGNPPENANTTLIFNPDVVKTKSQLTDIWNKANKK